MPIVASHVTPGSFVAVCNVCSSRASSIGPTPTVQHAVVQLRRRGWNVSNGPNHRTVECPSCVSAIDRKN